MATAPAITSKSERASQLRAEAQTLGKEVSQLREKLEIAQRALGVTPRRRGRNSPRKPHAAGHRNPEKSPRSM